MYSVLSPRRKKGNKQRTARRRYHSMYMGEKIKTESTATTSPRNFSFSSSFFHCFTAWLRFMKVPMRRRLFFYSLGAEGGGGREREEQKLTRREGIISFPEGWGVKKAGTMAPAAAGRLSLFGVPSSLSLSSKRYLFALPPTLRRLDTCFRIPFHLGIEIEDFFPSRLLEYKA